MCLFERQSICIDHKSMDCNLGGFQQSDPKLPKENLRIPVQSNADTRQLIFQFFFYFDRIVYLLFLFRTSCKQCNEQYSTLCLLYLVPKLTCTPKRKTFSFIPSLYFLYLSFYMFLSERNLLACLSVFFFCSGSSKFVMLSRGNHSTLTIISTALLPSSSTALYLLSLQ